MSQKKEDGKLKKRHWFGIISLIIAGIFVFYLANTILDISPLPSQIREYTGVLESISYQHSGWFHSISATILHFEDRDFELSGEHIYQLGKTYHVTYALFTNSDKVWTVLSVNLVEQGEST